MQRTWYFLTSSLLIWWWRFLRSPRILCQMALMRSWASNQPPLPFCLRACFFCQRPSCTTHYTGWMPLEAYQSPGFPRQPKPRPA